MINISSLKIFITTIFIFLNFTAFSQTSISGLIHTANNNVAPSINITLEKNKKIVSYTFSDDKGNYSIKTKTKGNFQLIFSGLGFLTKTIEIEITEESKDIIINQTLEEKSFELDEVIIASEKPITIKKDTIIFNVNAFEKGNEEVLEDVLKNLPGVEVDKNGTVRIGGKEIEKVMIEGDDFFEKGYRILTRSMPTQDIDKVEVYQKYSNNRLLKGIEDSDKVVLNLKLKEDAKRQWFGNVNIKQGISPFNRYEVRANLINLGKKNKYYFLTNLNSIGNNPIGDVNHLIRSTNINEPSTIGDDQKVVKIHDLTARVPNIANEKTNFNNAELLSLNAIFNPTKKVKVKALGFFNSDNREFFKKNSENILFNETNFNNLENFQLINKEKRAFIKLDIIYNISNSQELMSTSKYNNSNEKDMSNLIFNSISTTQNISSLNQLLDQKIIFTNRFEKTKVLLLTGRFIYEELPQTYHVNRFFYQELFPEINNANNVLQKNKNKNTFLGIEAHLLNRKENKDLFELKIGNEYKKANLLSEFSLLENNILLNSPIDYQNDVRYITNNLYIKSKYLVHLNKFDVIGEIGIHKLYTSLKFNGVKPQEVSPFFVNPTIAVKWYLNDNNKITSSYSYNTVNTQIEDVLNNYILNDYRSFTKGIGVFNQLNNSSTILQYQLGDWSDDFFANVSIFYSQNHNFLSTNSNILQNFSQVDKILIKNQDIFSASTNADRYIDFIKANVKIKFLYSKSNFKNIVNDSNLREVTSKSFNYGLELRSGFKGIFNYHIGTKWINNIVKTTFNNSFTDNISFADTSFSFNNKLNIDIKTERYFFGNLVQSESTYYFLDIDAKYKIKKNKITLSLQARNLFNTDVFRSSSISDLGTSTTEYRLLPRFLLLGLNYSF